jgi:SAM-dependent methyltransferase
MRIAGVEKMGYYPTPAVTLRLVCSLLAADQGAALRVLDPCAGEGEALAAVAACLRQQGAQVTAYGVELSPPRAEAARGKLDRVIAGDWGDVTTRNNAYDLLWLNPPYDLEAGDPGDQRKRQEYRFLQATYEKLRPGGVLVYIVPRWLLARPEVSRFLAGHFTDHSVWRLPDGEYEQYKQIVMFGYRRVRAEADALTEDHLRGIGEGTGELPSLSEADCTYRLPPGQKTDRFFFQKISLSPEEASRLAADSGVLVSRSWQDFTGPRELGTFRPVVPLRRGHLAMLLASGLMGTVNLSDVVAKGRAVKEEYEVTGETEDDADQPDKIIKRERFVTRVFALTRDGDYQVIESNTELEGFLERYGGQMARLIEAQHTPLYERPTCEEWSALGGLLPGKPLPGSTQSGLLEAQKHVAIAAARAIRRVGHAHIVAEMGYGKSATALAVAELLGDWPALVLCPSHLVEKWAREVQSVIPGARAVIMHCVGDIQSLAATYCRGEKVVAVLSKEQAKLGSGWRHALVPRRQRGADGLIQVWACPHCGAVLVDGDEIPILDLGNKRHVCSTCGEPLYCYTGLRGGKGSGFSEYLRREQALQDSLASGQPVSFAPLTGGARWPLARYLRDHLKGFFRLLIADEVQHYKAKASDQGTAFQDLVNACGRTLTLTGTIFGGKSTSLFWLLYRLDGALRRDFRFHDETRWAARYGRLEHVLKKQEADDDAHYSGQRRYYERAKEIPGISPQIVSRVLPSTIFARIADLGYELPPYNEEIVRLEMLPAQADQYRWLDDTLQGLVKAARKDGDNGLLSVWLQNVLARPNSGFRLEEVVRRIGKATIPVLAAGGNLERSPEEAPMVLPPVVAGSDYLPKEVWLADFCRSEAHRGRKTLVYLRQTGTRDIQPRVAEVLKSAGLRVATLPDAVNARERERWIGERVGGMDVLLTNPRKVETGLDLVRFATVVFAEIEYSLYTTWQSMRRVWRLGQVQPVKVVYAIYHDTMEEAALALMGRKLKAALLLYGDNASSAIAEEAGDDGDFLAELAARVLARERLTADGLSGLLQGDVRTTTRTWGSYTQESVVLLSALDDWARRHGFANLEAARSALRSKGRSRRPSGNRGIEQTGLFD